MLIHFIPTKRSKKMSLDSKMTSCVLIEIFEKRKSKVFQKKKYISIIHQKANKSNELGNRNIRI